MHKKLFAVIGNPIAHSLSPQLHQDFAKACGIKLTYKKYCIATEGDIFENFVRDFFKQGGHGLNITLPFKQRAFQVVNQLTERSRLAGVVNTIIPLTRTTLLGDNSDGIGLVRDLIDTQKQVIHGKSILILGSGGAAKGIFPALQAENPSKIIIASRANPAGLPYEQLTDSFDIIINATPLSLLNQLPPISSRILHANSFCYDLAYNKNRITVFTEWAKTHGLAHCDGLGMLTQQAAEAFYQWHGVRPIV